MQDPDTGHMEPDEPNADGQPNDTADVENEQVTDKPEHVGPDYRFKLPKNATSLLDEIDVDSPVGVNIYELKYDSKKSEEYNLLSSEIIKTLARDIDFDKCASRAKKILKQTTKDLQVATWFCIASLWSEAGTETDKLRGFRDALGVLNELLARFGDSLYPEDPDEKISILEDFIISERLDRLESIVMQQKVILFKVTDQALQHLLEQKVPVSIRNDLKDNLLNEVVEGEEIFLRRLKERVFERYNPTPDQLKKMVADKLIETPDLQSGIAYYIDLIVDVAQMPVQYPDIEFRVSEYALYHLGKSDLPPEILHVLNECKGMAEVKQDQFEGLMEDVFYRIRSQSDQEEAERLCQLIVDLCNENRWLFF